MFGQFHVVSKDQRLSIFQAARYYFNRRNRLDVTVTHFERADTEKKGMTPPSTPAGGGYIPNK